MEKPLILLDVDGTIADLTDHTLQFLHELALSPVDYKDKVLKVLHSLKRRKLEDAYTHLTHLLKHPVFKEQLYYRIKDSIYPFVIPHLKELSSYGEIYLYSRSPHILVKLLSEVLRNEFGIETKPLGYHPAVHGDVRHMKNKLNFEALAPKRPFILHIDNEDVERLPSHMRITVKNSDPPSIIKGLERAREILSRYKHF